VTAITDHTVTDAGLLDAGALVQRILDHIDAGTTDLADRTWREPVENYRSPDRLAAEVRRVLRPLPTAFCPSVALPEAGSFITRTVAGVPLLVVRGSDGIVRAFRNACRHRGMAIASGTGCTRSLVCPYHGWVYRLDGALRHVPGEHGFPELDKTTRGLTAVGAHEQRGVVFVTLEPEAGATLDDLPPLLDDGPAVLRAEEMVLDANWKLFTETFLEGYHIKSTHPETFYPFGFDNLTVVEPFGSRHTRVTFPFRRIERLRDVPVPERRIDGEVISVYHLFPNAVVGRFTHHSVLLVLEPLEAGRTRMITYVMSNRGPGEEAVADAERDYAFLNTGGAEDRAMAAAVQRGLDSGANETLEFGRFEGALSRFHRQLHELVDGGG
jgi:phenylpropionate dioxygenase-like ring-hydroxylating dioxygenase large terminal subunit